MEETAQPTTKPLLIATTSGWLSALVVGGIVFAASYALTLRASDPDDGWAELGAAIVGLGVGGLVGLALFLFVGVPMLLRAARRDRRWAVVAAYLLTPFVAATVLGAMSPVPAFVALTPLVIALPWLTVLWAGGELRHHWMALSVGVVLVASVAAQLIGAATSPY